MTVNLVEQPRPALTGPFATRPDPDGIAVTPAIEGLVATQVQALLERSPAYYEIDETQRTQMQKDLTKIAAYSAALLHDGFGQAEQLHQVPVLRRRSAPSSDRAPVVRSAADQSAFGTRAVDRVAAVTEDTLGAIDFPNFVADLIRGTFDAIVTSSIQQMEAYGELLANVAKTVDQYMADNITDNQARDYLASRYPGHISVDTQGGAPRARRNETGVDLPPPNYAGDLGVDLQGDADDDTIEEILVPAARRQLAQSRHQLLSTMVLMGINRIVVTSGRVKAKLDFHIDASDTGRAETASQFDFKHDTVAAGGFLGFGAASRTSVAYVKTAKQVSTDEINVDVDLTGELDLKFRSETFPLERFAETDVIGRIQAGTANPGSNPVASRPPTTPPE